ncbi:MAG: ABC transporter permease [Pyrinomonadaceae bacterium]
MKTLTQDFRYGVRLLLKRPEFTLVAVIVLALGIGGNTAIFSVVNAVLFRPLPFKNSDRIVVPVSTNQERGFDSASVAYADYLDWRSDDRLFEAVAVYRETNFDLTGSGGEPERVPAVIASEDYSSVIGVEPLIGRRLTVEDSKPDAVRTIVLTYDFWQKTLRR